MPAFGSTLELLERESLIVMYVPLDDESPYGRVFAAEMEIFTGDAPEFSRLS
ncbi:TPA: hypothetical protein QDB23_001661 [Burkholderia vietnamiensis]|nr:hypothetical protein [Burkholderia vietnamiensis]